MEYARKAAEKILSPIGRVLRSAYDAMRNDFYGLMDSLKTTRNCFDDKKDLTGLLK